MTWQLISTDCLCISSRHHFLSCQGLAAAGSAVLSAHRSIVLRQCSKALMRLVGACAGVALQFVASAVMLSMQPHRRSAPSTCRQIAAAFLLQHQCSSCCSKKRNCWRPANAARWSRMVELLHEVAAVSWQLSSTSLTSQRDRFVLGALLAEPQREERFVELLQKQLPSESGTAPPHLVYTGQGSLPCCCRVGDDVRYVCACWFGVEWQPAIFCSLECAASAAASPCRPAAAPAAPA